MKNWVLGILGVVFLVLVIGMSIAFAWDFSFKAKGIWTTLLFLDFVALLATFCKWWDTKGIWMVMVFLSSLLLWFINQKGPHRLVKGGLQNLDELTLSRLGMVASGLLAIVMIGGFLWLIYALKGPTDRMYDNLAGKK